MKYKLFLGPMHGETGECYSNINSLEFYEPPNFELLGPQDTIPDTVYNLKTHRYLKHPIWSGKDMYYVFIHEDYDVDDLFRELFK